MEALHNLTIAEAAEGLAKKEFSSLELTQSCLDRIHAVEGKVDAFLALDETGALAQAKEFDKSRGKKKTSDPLGGIPVALKDNMMVQGLQCSAGSRMLENYRAPYDATVVTKLKNAGAVIVGKTNMDEFAMGSSTETSAFKKTKNPWDLSMIPGGSSGGSAAAVASDEAIYALGSDTGGSIRQPASLCGVVGLKPTYGSVSRYGLIAMASSFDVIGPITKTVKDARLVFDAIRGVDVKDSTTVSSELSSERKKSLALGHGLKGLKIGVPKEYFIEGIDRATEEVIRKSIDVFKECGAEIIPMSLPHTEYGLPVYYILMPAEVSTNLARLDGMRYGLSETNNPKSAAKNLFDIYTQSRAQGFGDEVKRRIMLGTYVLSAGYADKFYKKAAAVRALIKKDFDNAFLNVDCICSPTTPSPAWELGARVTDPLTMYLSDIFTVSANIAGVPAMSVPCGYAYDLPVGLQLMAPQFCEDILFTVGEAYEGATGREKKRAVQLS